MSKHVFVFSRFTLLAAAAVSGCTPSREYTDPDAQVQDSSGVNADAAQGGKDASEQSSTQQSTGAAGSTGNTSSTGVSPTLNVTLVMDAGVNDAGGGQSTNSDADNPVSPGCTKHAECDDGNECNGVERCEEGRCVSGAIAENGRVCEGVGEGAYVCRNGNCLKSRCGDGIVDARLDEVCDDGNVRNGDGCNVDCNYSCEDNEQCADNNVCNGEEVCDLDEHVCVAGPSAADGTECGSSRACTDGRCVSTTCGDGVVTEGEECDDGNLVEGDGCTADCQYDCEEDADCDDEDVCNGTERCNLETHQCELGAALECDDGVPCTENTCDPQLGCRFPLIDEDGDGQAPVIEGSRCGADCDDHNAQVFAGAGELCDGIDNNCDGKIDEIATVWYADCDGDGYAAPDSESVQQCDKPAAPSSCPPGLQGTWTIRPPVSALESDCWDADPDVYPRADAVWSRTAIEGRKKNPFDYNCDSVDEPQYTTVGVATDSACSPLVLQPSGNSPIEALSSSSQLGGLLAQQVAPGSLALRCTGKSGWAGRSAPACGNPGTYSYCDGCTRVVDEQFVQACQ